MAFLKYFHGKHYRFLDQNRQQKSKQLSWNLRCYKSIKDAMGRFLGPNVSYCSLCAYSDDTEHEKNCREEIIVFLIRKSYFKELKSNVLGTRIFHQSAPATKIPDTNMILVI
jgi:hypothetical protein